ncbi:hypothetical protein [Martelella soudanensis]|uniref:hypothetical protein n=1 Tax=unclassified Martelella TaxID=2629616 RepID=UPI0015DF7C74|nr:MULTISPECIES: hypothetical protein [unclassified Martelella]
MTSSLPIEGATLDNAALEATIRSYASANDMAVADCVAAVVRSFLDQADDDTWLQLVGIMGRAEDPGLAALRAILLHYVGDLKATAVA